MAYNLRLAARIREKFEGLAETEEKEMMGGLAFMYKGKMCIGVIGDEMMIRIDPALHDEIAERNGCREMDFTGKPMKGWLMADDSAIRNPADFEFLTSLAFAWNENAKKSVKRKKGK